MTTTLKTLCAAFLAITALGAGAGLASVLFEEADKAQPAATEAPRARNDENVTRVQTPDQTGITTPERFIAGELEAFVLPEGENLAKGKRAKANDFTDVYSANQATDGRDRTYWEGASFPGWLSVDLAEPQTISKVVLQLPPLRVWGKRTQTVTLYLSEDEETWTEAAKSAPYEFTAETGNAVLIALEPTKARYVKVEFQSNTGAKGGQLSEVYVFE